MGWILHQSCEASTCWKNFLAIRLLLPLMTCQILSRTFAEQRPSVSNLPSTARLPLAPNATARLIPLVLLWKILMPLVVGVMSTARICPLMPRASCPMVTPFPRFLNSESISSNAKANSLGASPKNSSLMLSVANWSPPIAPLSMPSSVK